jgi:hypothetical protein
LTAEEVGRKERTYGHAHEGLLIIGWSTHFCGLSKMTLIIRIERRWIDEKLKSEW